MSWGSKRSIAEVYTILRWKATPTRVIKDGKGLVLALGEHRKMPINNGSTKQDVGLAKK
jgi:hypothetical protein